MTPLQVTVDAEIRNELRARASHAMLALAADDWELCRFRCLTNSGSVLHQNSYRSALKHCYGIERSSVDIAMSINSIDPDLKVDYFDLDPRDPYVSSSISNDSFVFPCRTEGCAVPEQDRARLQNAAVAQSRQGEPSRLRRHSDGDAKRGEMKKLRNRNGRRRATGGTSASPSHLHRRRR